MIEVLVGFVAGMLAGIMGVGGGVVLIPVMVVLMDVDQHTAQGVSLAVIAMVSLFGAITHFRQETLRSDVAIWIVPGAIIFILLGSLLANQVDASFLRDLVGGVIIIVGVLTVLRDWRSGGLAS
ncbi:MAG: sulfite exporter TauE/SafE family protein [Chloroflexota bacterium]|nr:sulfite exporter TauE/SafE family protein [Chloroflexota bacterium]